MTAPTRGGPPEPGAGNTRPSVELRTLTTGSGGSSTAECKSLTDEPRLSIRQAEAAVCGALGCRATEELRRVDLEGHAPRVLCVEHAEHFVATRVEATASPAWGTGRRGGADAEQRKRSAADAPRRGERRENRAEAEAGPLPWGPDPTRSGDRAKRGRAPEPGGRSPSGRHVVRRRSR
jgi:hypothetical protein